MSFRESTSSPSWEWRLDVGGNQTRPGLNVSFHQETTTPLDPWLNDYVIAGAILLSVVIVLLLVNILMFSAILDMIVSKKTRGSSTGPILILNLAVANILIGITSLLTLTKEDIDDLEASRKHCLLMTAMITTPSVTSMLVMTAIAVNRYLDVTRPFRSERNAIKKALFISFLIWLFSSLVGYAPLMGWNSGEDFVYNGSCHFLSTVGPSYVLFIFFGILLPIILVSLILYLVMCQISRKQRSRITLGKFKPSNEENNHAWVHNQSAIPEEGSLSTVPATPRRHFSVPNQRELTASILTVLDSGIATGQSSFAIATPKPPSPHSQTRRSSVLHQPKRSLQRQASRIQTVLETIRHKKPDKSLRTIVLIMGCLVCMWSPFLVACVIETFCGDTCQLDDLISTYLLLLGVTSAAINPVVYISTDQRLKKHFLRCLFHSSGTQLISSSLMYTDTDNS